MTRPTKRQMEQRVVRAAIPNNWLDPLLSGPKAVIGMPPYDCRDIESLLNAIRARVDAALRAKGKR